MPGKSISKREMQKTGEVTVSFTVAECGEFHNFGEYHDDIKTAGEAAAIYRSIPLERMHGIPAIGIRLHRKGRPAYEDIQADILIGGEIDTEPLYFEPEVANNPLVQEAVGALEKMFPGKETADR